MCPSSGRRVPVVQARPWLVRGQHWSICLTQYRTTAASQDNVLPTSRTEPRSRRRQPELVCVRPPHAAPHCESTPSTHPSIQHVLRRRRPQAKSIVVPGDLRGNGLQLDLRRIRRERMLCAAGLGRRRLIQRDHTCTGRPVHRYVCLVRWAGRHSMVCVKAIYGRVSCA